MKITNYNLVLGSNSPRRKEILTEMGLSFYTRVSDKEEKFSEKSSPTYLDKYGNRITLQEIHDEADIGDKSVVLIAVTSEQYNKDNFSKYREYIENKLKKDIIYYGLWPDTKKNKTEWDVVYTIDNNSDEIQRHLNLHDHMNNGLAQKMALIIDKDGKWKIQNNEKL